MPKLSHRASKRAKARRMQEEMDKWKAGTLHSGSKRGPIVRSHRQAIAIGLSESGQSRQQLGRRKRRRKRVTKR